MGNVKQQIAEKNGKHSSMQCSLYHAKADMLLDLRCPACHIYTIRIHQISSDIGLSSADANDQLMN